MTNTCARREAGAEGLPCPGAAAAATGYLRCLAALGRGARPPLGYIVTVCDLEGPEAERIERTSLGALVAAAHDYLAHASEGEAEMVVAYHDDDGWPCGRVEFRLSRIEQDRVARMTKAEAEFFMAELERCLCASGHDFTRHTS